MSLHELAKPSQAAPNFCTFAQSFPSTLCDPCKNQYMPVEARKISSRKDRTCEKCTQEYAIICLPRSLSSMDLPHLPSAFAMATTPETESLANQPSVSAKPELALIHLISAALTCRIGLPVSVAKERLAETDWKPSVFSMSWHDEKYHNIHTCLLTAIKPWHIEVMLLCPHRGVEALATAIQARASQWYRLPRLKKPQWEVKLTS